MSWSVDIKPRLNMGLPPMMETVASFSDCPGNICTSITELGFKKLPHIAHIKGRLEALEALIRELNLGNEGRFKDDYFVMCDQKWSQGAESAREWEKWIPIPVAQRPFWAQTYEALTGYIGRDRMLRDAERFYLLLKAGYDVEFTW